MKYLAEFRDADILVVGSLAEDIGRKEHYHPTEVAVYFGEPNKKVPDPYFDGEGPERVGCNFCGACMTGCRHNAKNTLDKNYLYLAQQLGVEIMAEQEANADAGHPATEQDRNTPTYTHEQCMMSLFENASRNPSTRNCRCILPSGHARGKRGGKFAAARWTQQ